MPRKAARNLTPFDILGVSPADDHATIRKAWKRLVKANHPDRCPADAARLTRRLQELNEAYDKLRNHAPIRRTRNAKADAGREAAAHKAAAAKAREAARRGADRARAEAEHLAREAARAAARTAAEAARKAAAPRYTAAQRAALDTATRAFSDARATFLRPAAHGYATAA